MDTFKDLVWHPFIMAGLEVVSTAIPILKIPPISWFLAWIVPILADALYEKADLIWDLKKIAFKNQEHLRIYEMASSRLAILARDKGINSEDFKNAREANRAALSKFVRFST